MREAQKQEIKTKTFSDIVQASESISKTYALKKFMDWTDVELLANREFMRKDMAFNWELEQIKAGGPNWKEAAMAGVQPAEGGELGAAGGGGGVGGGGASALPPSFGPTPGGAPEAAPTGEVAPEAGGAVPGATPVPPTG